MMLTCCLLCCKCFFYTINNSVHNSDISSRLLKKKAMQEHLLQCIKVGKFVEFPESGPTKIVLYCLERSAKFDVFRNCRLPWVWYHSKNKDLNTTQRDSCKKWFHQKSRNIPDFVFEKKPYSPWYCFSCT